MNQHGVYKEVKEVGYCESQDSETGIKVGRCQDIEDFICEDKKI